MLTPRLAAGSGPEPCRLLYCPMLLDVCDITLLVQVMPLGSRLPDSPCHLHPPFFHPLLTGGTSTSASPSPPLHHPPSQLHLLQPPAAPIHTPFPPTLSPLP